MAKNWWDSTTVSRGRTGSSSDHGSPRSGHGHPHRQYEQRTRQHRRQQLPFGCRPQHCGQGGDARLVAAKSTVQADGSADMTTPLCTPAPRKSWRIPSCKPRSPTRYPGQSGRQTGAGTTYEPAWVPRYRATSHPPPTGLGHRAARDPRWTLCQQTDEGNIYTSGGAVPYYNGENQTNSSVQDIVSYFTANRIIPSAVMFGSLPTA